MTAIANDGTVYTWGYNGHGELGNGGTTASLTPIQVPNLSDVKDIATGYYHIVVLKEDGTVWAVGRNNYGQLGNASTTDLTIPENISSDYIHTNKNEVIIKGIGKTEKIAAEYVKGFNLYNDKDGTSLVYA